MVNPNPESRAVSAVNAIFITTLHLFLLSCVMRLWHLLPIFESLVNTLVYRISHVCLYSETRPAEYEQLSREIKNRPVYLAHWRHEQCYHTEQHPHEEREHSTERPIYHLLAPYNGFCFNRSSLYSGQTLGKRAGVLAVLKLALHLEVDGEILDVVLGGEILLIVCSLGADVHCEYSETLDFHLVRVLKLVTHHTDHLREHCEYVTLRHRAVTLYAVCNGGEGNSSRVDSAPIPKLITVLTVVLSCNILNCHNPFPFSLLS